MIRSTSSSFRIAAATAWAAPNVLLPLLRAERQDRDLAAQFLVPLQPLLDGVFVEEIHNLLDPLGVDAQVGIDLDRVIAGNLLHTDDDVHVSSVSPSVIQVERFWLVYHAPALIHAGVAASAERGE